MHFYALDHMKNILGVEICDSVGEFAEWLSPHAKIGLPNPGSYPCPRVVVESDQSSDVSLTEEDHSIIW